MASKAMFRIECFCDEHNLAPVLLALAGYKAVEVRSTPVINAQITDGVISARTNGNSVDLFREWCNEKGLTYVTANDARQFQIAHGRSPNGYSSVLSQSQKAGLLKRRKGYKPGQKSGYEVVAAKS